MSNNLAKWKASRTPEELKAHYEKMAEARRAAAAARKAKKEAIFTVDPNPYLTTVIVADPVDPNAAAVRDCLKEMVLHIQGRSGGGTRTTKWCDWCGGDGFGIHQGEFGCDCVCHRAYKLLGMID